MKKQCKTCAHFDLEGAKSESGRVMNNRTSTCNFKIDISALKIPEACHSIVVHEERLGDPMYTWANYGETCSAWEKRA